jgi:hypothetical protein
VAAINLRQRNWRLRPKNLYRLSRAVFQAKLLATARSNFCVAPSIAVDSILKIWQIT